MVLVSTVPDGSSRQRTYGETTKRTRPLLRTELERVPKNANSDALRSKARQLPRVCEASSQNDSFLRRLPSCVLASALAQASCVVRDHSERRCLFLDRDKDRRSPDLRSYVLHILILQR
ncbi:hypothetical protein EVAR_7455_1 [Eumeta japonica]|uniref:Uncharacterized protein n=1 Tax=Eumeta variegata TaxID=151549 RepID=A0A4C1V7W9_EUMVA|nr:hypothetical protein EVAR_7455_1 [Eumeta japonica]